PHFQGQLVVVGDLSETRRFDRVVALAHGRVNGINRNEADAQVLVEVFVGRGVPTAAFQAHFHVEFAALAHRRDVDVFVEHFHVAIGFDHATGDHARLIRAQINRLGRVAGELEWNLFQVEDDVSRVLDYTRDERN